MVIILMKILGFFQQHKFHLVVPLSPSDMSLKPETLAWKLSSLLPISTSCHLLICVVLSPIVVQILVTFSLHLPTLTLDQGLANFFWKGSDTQYFLLCRPYSLYHSYSTLATMDNYVKGWVWLCSKKLYLPKQVEGQTSPQNVISWLLMWSLRD